MAASSMMSDPKVKLATARLMACRRAPYLSAALIALVPRERVGFGTLGVSHRGIMLYDPAVVLRWTIEELAAVLTHEVSHMVRDHHGRCQHLAAAPNTKRTIIDGREYHHDAQAWNMAGDAAINSDLIAMGLELPDSPVTPETLGLEPGQSSEQYYAAIVKQQEEDEKKGKQGGKGEGEGDEQEGQGEGQGDGDKQGNGEGEGEGDAEGEGAGAGKSKADGAGNAKGGGAGGPPQKKPAPGSAKSRCGSSAGNPTDYEPSADDPENRTPTDMQRVRREVAEAVREAASRGRGNVPGGWSRWAEQFAKPSRIPWQQKLARHVRRAVASRAGCADYKYDRPSRRQSAIGFGPGRPILPRMHAPVPQVAVAVDTSGSMGTDEMSRALAETRAVLKAIGTPVTFLACDTQVHGVKQVRDVREAVELLKGGGGTDFRPIFEELTKQRSKPDIIIVVTDGCGPAPSVPPNAHVIWLLVGAYKQKPTCDTGAVEYGEFVEVDESEEAAAA